MATGTLTKGEYYIDRGSGKMELHFDKESYMALPQDLRGDIKRYFLFSRGKGAWISKGQANTWMPQEIVKKLGFQKAGETGEKVTFAERMETKAERAAERAERYEGYSASARQRQGQLQKQFNELRGDIAFLTQPGRFAWRDKIVARYEKGFAEAEKAKHFEEEAERLGKASTQSQLKNPRYLDNRISQGEAALRKIERDAEEYRRLDREVPQHLEERATDELDKLMFYKKAMGDIGGVKYGQANVSKGDKVKTRFDWGIVKSTGPKNMTILFTEGGAMGMELKLPYAEIKEHQPQKQAAARVEPKTLAPKPETKGEGKPRTLGSGNVPDIGSADKPVMSPYGLPAYRKDGFWHYKGYSMTGSGQLGDWARVTDPRRQDEYDALYPNKEGIAKAQVEVQTVLAKVEVKAEAKSPTKEPITVGKGWLGEAKPTPKTYSPSQTAKVLGRYWNGLDETERTQLLKLAARPADLKSRQWEQLPTDVQDGLLFATPDVRTMGKALRQRMSKPKESPKPTKEPWEMTKAGYAEAQKQKSRELIEAWNKAGSHGIPPTAAPSIYEIAPLAERAGYVMPRDAEKVLQKPYHRLQVEAAIHEGKRVLAKVLKDYPELGKTTPEVIQRDTAGRSMTGKITIENKTFFFDRASKTVGLRTGKGNYILYEQTPTERIIVGEAKTQGELVKLAQARVATPKAKAVPEPKAETSSLDKAISAHRNNVRAWFKEPSNWGNKERLTYREVSQQVANDKDLVFKKVEIPVDPNRPLGETKAIYQVELEGKKLREFPKEVYDYYQSIKVAIPKAAPGMPEAGLQTDIFGKTTPVMPKGKARYATASMEDFAKLQKAKAEASPKEIFGTLSHEDASELVAGLDLRTNALEERIDQGKATLESIKESLDPRIAKLTELIPTTKEGRSEITHITKGKYKKVWDKEPPSSIVTKGGQVRWEYALDTIAQELHLESKAQTEGKAPDEYLKGLIEDAKDTKELIRATESEIGSDESTLKALDKLKGTIKGRTGKVTDGSFLKKLAHPKVKVTAKPKPVTRAKAMLAGVAQALIEKTQRGRTSLAIAIDNSLLAKQVVPIASVNVWAKHPNRYDIRGVDTPGRGRIVAGVAYADKGKKRLSRKHHRGFRKIKFT